MTIEELNNTDESKWLLFKFQEFYEEMKQRNAFEKNDYSPQEKYIENCFNYHSRILDTCSQLEQITIFMRRFDKKYFISNGIGQAEFIQYHLEVYVNKLYTLGELLLQLTNVIYQLDIKPSQCSFQKVKNKLDNELQSYRILEQFFTNLKNWRLIRNRTVHENRFSKDDTFDRLSTEEMLWRHYDSMNYTPKIDWIIIKPRHFVDWFLKQERKNKIQFIRKNNLETNKYIALFDKSTNEKIKFKMAMHNKL